MTPCPVQGSGHQRPPVRPSQNATLALRYNVMTAKGITWRPTLRENLDEGQDSRRAHRFLGCGWAAQASRRVPGVQHHSPQVRSRSQERQQRQSVVLSAESGPDGTGPKKFRLI